MFGYNPLGLDSELQYTTKASLVWSILNLNSGNLRLATEENTCQKLRCSAGRPMNQDDVEKIVQAMNDFRHFNFDII